MVRVIIVNTGTKFSQWYTDNLIHMVKTYANFDNPTFEVITEEEYVGVFNKFQIFDKFRDGQNIFFDLDVVIKGDLNHLLRKDLHVCHAYWRKPFHTPICSDVISWEGDRSDISDLFKEDPEYYQLKYRCKYPDAPDGQAGMDEFLFKNFNYQYSTYGEDDRIVSYRYVPEEYVKYPIYLFNQRYQEMLDQPHAWFHKFLLPS